MSQLTPDLPSDSAFIPISKTENEISHRVLQWAQRIEGGTCVPCSLRPAPLFRSIGLTGVSEVLPPHRRLRSILHKGSAVLPAGANNNDSTKSLLEGASKRKPPFKGQKSSRLHVAEVSDSYDFLPDIVSPNPKTQTNQETASRRGSHPVNELDIQDCSRFQAQVGLHLKSNPSLTENIRRRHSTGHSLPLKPHISRRTIMCPFAPSDAENTEEPARAVRKRLNKRISNTPAFSQSEDVLISNKGMNDICQWVHSLAITSKEQDRPSINKRDSQSQGSPNKRDFNRRTNGLEGKHEEKETCHVRRDRRPHFLPPISQLGCLLDVPIILLENSPPPSPSCTPSPPFFSLHVPAPPLGGPRGRDT